jgi:hypothetical protein
MLLPDSSEFRWNKLITDNSSGLSTEGIIQVASQLSDGETIFCTTLITPIVKLMVNLDNEVNTKDIINVSLKVLNHDQMRHSLLFHLAISSIQRAHFFGRSLVDPGRLSMEDVVNTFGLDDSTRWHLWGYNFTIDGHTRGFRQRE